MADEIQSLNQPEVGNTANSNTQAVANAEQTQEVVDDISRTQVPSMEETPTLEKQVPPMSNEVPAEVNEESNTSMSQEAETAETTNSSGELEEQVQAVQEVPEMAPITQEEDTSVETQSVTDSAETTTQEASNNEDTSIKKSHTKLFVIIIAILAILVIAGSAAYYFMVVKKQVKNTVVPEVPQTTVAPVETQETNQAKEQIEDNPNNKPTEDIIETLDKNELKSDLKDISKALNETDFEGIDVEFQSIGL